MGFSTSGATVIIFVGLLIGLGVLAPSIQGASERVSDATDRRDDRQLRIANTAIEIANVSYDPGTDELTVAVDNVGAESLDVTETDLLVDGTYVEPNTTTVAGEVARTAWAPGEQLNLTVDNHGTDPSRVKVVAETGVASMETGV